MYKIIQCILGLLERLTWPSKLIKLPIMQMILNCAWILLRLVILPPEILGAFSISPHSYSVNLLILKKVSNEIITRGILTIILTFEDQIT